MNGTVRFNRETTADEVVANWNRLKANERKAEGFHSALEGIARTLPALTRAQKLGSRARELQTGLVRSYALAIAASLAVLAVVFVAVR